MKDKTTKLLEEYVKGYMHDFRVRKYFSKKTQKASIIKEEIETLHYFRINNFCSSKDTRESEK